MGHVRYKRINNKGPELTVMQTLVFNRVNDMWPESSLVGGSFALHSMRPEVPYGDIDIYLGIKITRYMLLEVLEHVIFKDFTIQVIEKEQIDIEECGFADRQGSYNMPGIRKRVVVVADDGYVSGRFDFIIVDPYPSESLLDWFFDNQASNLTEVCIGLDFSPRKMSTYISENYPKSCPDLNSLSKGCLIMNKGNHCTAEHAKKLTKLASLLDLTAMK